MVGKYKLTHVGLFVGLLFACIFILGSRSWAISGAGSYFPDTSPGGQGPSYTVVQVTAAGQPGANFKMKAQTTVANVYVNTILQTHQ